MDQKTLDRANKLEKHIKAKRKYVEWMERYILDASQIRHIELQLNSTDINDGYNRQMIVIEGGTKSMGVFVTLMDIILSNYKAELDEHEKELAAL